VALATSGDEGRYVIDGKPLRQPDGFHLSPAGARVVWERIRAKALHLVENRTHPSLIRRTQRWRAAPSWSFSSSRLRECRGGARSEQLAPAPTCVVDIS
jgi:hypothetical protein